MSTSAQDTDTTGRLSRRPEAVGFSVERIVLDAVDGKIRVPEFQRPLRWKSKDVIDFFDSIRRGFPIGELLLSRGEADSATVKFGSVEVNASHSLSALWVVDGQQRITALVATLQRDESCPRQDTWAIWYDLEKREFHRLNKKEPAPTWIPLNVTLDSKKLLQWIRHWPYANDRDDLVDEALELGKSVREYQMPAYIVDGAEESVLRLIFTRSNNAGAPMKDSEVFDALYQSEGPSPITSAIGRLTKIGFGKLDEEFFLRCTKITNSIDEDVSLEELVERLDSSAISRTETALSRAIQTLMSAGIPHVKLLPYRLGLLVLVKLYSRFPEQDHCTDRLAGYWLWHGFVTAELEHSSRANLGKAVRIINRSTDSQRACLSLMDALPKISDIDSPAVKRDPRSELDRKISTQRAAVQMLLVLLYEKFDQSRDQLTIPQDEGALSLETLGLEIEHPYESLVNGEQTYSVDITIQLDGIEMSGLVFDNPECFLLDDDCVDLITQNDLDGFRNRRTQLLQDYLRDAINEHLALPSDLRPTIAKLSGSCSSNNARR